jgi:hypothetical protein
MMLNSKCKDKEYNDGTVNLAMNKSIPNDKIIKNLK